MICSCSLQQAGQSWIWIWTGAIVISQLFCNHNDEYVPKSSQCDMKMWDELLFALIPNKNRRLNITGKDGKYFRVFYKQLSAEN